MQVAAVYDGIDLCGNGNSATLNTVVGSDESAVHIDDSCGTGANADTATGNTINNACAGILVGPTATKRHNCTQYLLQRKHVGADRLQRVHAAIEADTSGSETSTV